VLLCDERDALAASLGERGIGTGVHYPLPLHHQPALADRVNINGSLEGAEQLAARCLSIPVYPELGEDERELVVARIAVLQSTGVS
jgi:dTDP-4-amino-4,6-dideoxygalactose transaminase